MCFVVSEEQVNNLSGKMFKWQEVPHENISPQRIAPTITSMEEDVMKYDYSSLQSFVNSTPPQIKTFNVSEQYVLYCYFYGLFILLTVSLKEETIQPAKQGTNFSLVYNSPPWTIWMTFLGAMCVITLVPQAYASVLLFYRARQFVNRKIKQHWNRVWCVIWLWRNDYGSYGKELAKKWILLECLTLTWKLKNQMSAYIRG